MGFLISRVWVPAHNGCDTISPWSKHQTIIAVSFWWNVKPGPTLDQALLCEEADIPSVAAAGHLARNRDLWRLTVVGKETILEDGRMAIMNNEWIIVIIKCISLLLSHWSMTLKPYSQALSTNTCLALVAKLPEVMSWDLDDSGDNAPDDPDLLLDGVRFPSVEEKWVVRSQERRQEKLWMFRSWSWE